MRKRELILDFTSLMDIFMIILFFFIIFSHMETQQAVSESKTVTENAQAQLAEAQDAMSEAERLAQEAQARLDRADGLLAELQQADGRTGENLAAITAFGEGQMLRMRLKMDGADWSLDVSCGDESVYSMQAGGDLPLTEILALAGYQPDDTILCEFIYDSSEDGTNSAYKQITSMLADARKSYTHLFCSEVDTAK